MSKCTKIIKFYEISSRIYIDNKLKTKRLAVILISYPIYLYVTLKFYLLRVYHHESESALLVHLGTSSFLHPEILYKQKALCASTLPLRIHIRTHAHTLSLSSSRLPIPSMTNNPHASSPNARHTTHNLDGTVVGARKMSTRRLRVIFALPAPYLLRDRRKLDGRGSSR